MPARGSVLVIDPFTVGGIEIGSDMPSQQARESFPYPSEILDRFVKGTGEDFWHVSMPSGSGELTYSTNASGGLAGFDVLTRYRFRSEHYDILTYDAFVLDFTRVSGRGTLEILVESQDVAVSVEAPGLLRVSLEMFENPGEFNDVGYVIFTFRPVTPEFSFTLAEISLVPEPSAFLLALAGGCAPACRRRRRRDGARE
jgi:hypothetical protein